MTNPPFRRVVVTGVECSGKTTLSRALAEKLGWAWVHEAARTHADVLSGKVTESTFDALHDLQTGAAKQAQDEGAPGVICDTGDLVLRLWSEDTLEFSWHPLSPPNPSVDLHILCPTLETWEPDPLRNLPRLEDRLALEQRYRDHLTLRAHVVAEGETLEARLSHVLDAWPW
jgi:nicotinamide riboside kinase